MKYRKGFVTNSSSSSYTCDVCGVTQSGWDIGMSEADMVECANGHIFCRDHIIKYKQKEEKVDIEEDEEEIEDDYDVDIKYCPICMFKEWIPEEMVAFLIKEYNLSKKELLKSISKTHGTYNAFKDYLKA
jgi:hypothetical protein